MKNAIVSLLLVAALVITGALAFLTAKDSAENKFTVGNVNISLTEPKWDEANPDGTLENIVAGQVITKDPTITNTGVNDAYVYMMVQVPKADNIAIDGEVVSDHQLFSFTPNAGWTCIAEKTDDNDANNYYLYAFDTALAPKGVANLFDKVTFANTTSDFEASSLKIEIEAYAIQSDFYNGEATNAQSAWNLYVNQSGWAFPSIKAPVVTPEGMSALNFVDEDGDVVHTEIAEVGSPVEMYFEPGLAKNGYAFDWVDEDTGNVAYSGMPMPEEDTTLAATYTETGYGSEALGTESMSYYVYGDETNGYTAVLYNIDANAPETVIIPSTITVTGDGTAEGGLIIVEGGKQVAYAPDAEVNPINGTLVVPVTEIAFYHLGEKSPAAALTGVLSSNAITKTLIIADSVSTIGVVSESNTHTSSGNPTLETVIFPYGTIALGNNLLIDCVKIKSVFIPNSVKFIGECAFSGTAITEIKIPNSVELIGEAAFSACYCLTDVIFDEGSVMKTIELCAFDMCESLVNIDFPDTIETIGYMAFAENLSLKNITLPSSLKTIEDMAFYGCTSLETITIPENVTTIGSAVFEACENLKTMNYNAINAVRDSVVGTELFYAPIETLNIGTNVEVINPYMFYGIKTLKTVNFADGCKLTTIGDRAFADCTALNNITLPELTINVSNYAFPSTCTVTYR